MRQAVCYNLAGNPPGSGNPEAKEAPMATRVSPSIERDTSIYARLGVRTIINARGATTAVGGTLPPPEVMAAMAEAAKAFVVLEELNAAVGEKIAAITGAEAG